MAANLLSFRPAGVRTCVTSSNRIRKSDLRAKTPSSNFWTPLFGWSSEPDYIDSDASNADFSSKDEAKSGDSSVDPKQSRSRFAPGCFTEEKAKQLRMMTSSDTASFHDIMYHSAIASRLASDFPKRPNP